VRDGGGSVDGVDRSCERGAAGGLGQALGGPALAGIGNVGFNPIAFTPGLSFNGGGIADGPRSGYPAMLHGREAVVPLADGRSIPVSMRGGAGGGMIIAEGSPEAVAANPASYTGRYLQPVLSRR
jgi:hypothetical protein